MIDSADVLVEVLDARDPQGTRCYQVEEFLKKEKPYKQLIFVLNKVDLVPVWVTVSFMFFFYLTLFGNFTFIKPLEASVGPAI